MPDQLAITPLPAAFDLTIDDLPGSKSLTNRALLLAALATGQSTLTGVLFSDDTRHMLDALGRLGFALTIDEGSRAVTVTGQGGAMPRPQAELHLGNSGTCVRSLTAACALGEGPYRIDGIARMRERPIGELVEPLRQIGADVQYLDNAGYPPLTVGSRGGLAGGELIMRPTLSSQFITALLMVGPCCRAGLTLRFEGAVTSRPYVEMTLSVMEAFGARASVDEAFTRVRVEAGTYAGRAYAIEPDASNASYFLAAAAVMPGSRCTITNLGKASLQGDVGFAEVLGQMGAQVTMSDDAITVASPATGQPLRGVDVDLNRMPDTAQTLGPVALFADGPTTIRNVGNLRVKETDRMAALQNELTKLGATVDVVGDDLRITPPGDGKLRPTAIDTYDDHRMAMGFAVAGLRSPGVVINDPACVNKTFPDYFDYLDRLRGASASPAAAQGRMG
ncbi:3-phosphoshikimate 1-carboxyvinyltransferase [Phycisphaerales bacterium AB-hyl4]|uniref:3-phosphoshikimate 1-carboxyvinyltransferase n=1 Tax=Natronomicrosphaera hydrolytica TaxID=3242702 RepID=A0ABV4U0S3_9BACT